MVSIVGPSFFIFSTFDKNTSNLLPTSRLRTTRKLASKIASFFFYYLPIHVLTVNRPFDWFWISKHLSLSRRRLLCIFQVQSQDEISQPNHDWRWRFGGWFGKRRLRHFTDKYLPNIDIVHGVEIKDFYCRTLRIGFSFT